ncbi:PAS domain S-box protein [Microcoleus sp. FACHB-68]|uniref:PAS domain S-box protein n=1 Tax=Microcoleus sp. FACHB-68 TaxID=2692826 RepID=UPI0016832247|nr:PAS domain S-box protein [Microcoleus sp. FACHB-68]MBD1936629.1 PAS domain S-box protein [Microcoleus sp. FACHB-68]
MYASEHELFRHFLEHLPYAVAMVDRQMRYLAVSRQWVQVHKLEDSDLIGRQFHVDFGMPVHSRPELQESQEHGVTLLGSPATVSHPELVSQTTEKLTWVSHPWHEDNGDIGGMIFSLIPTCSSPAKENELLREKEALFTATFEQAAVGISHSDPQGQFTHFNRKFCDIVGYTGEELRVLSWMDITHPDDLNIDWESQRRLVAGEIPTYSIEKRYIHKQGFPVWVNLTVSLMRDFNGELKYLIKVIEDIQDRKIAEAKLHKSEADLKAAQKIAHVGNWEFDVITQTITWSDEIFRIYGRDPNVGAPTYLELRQAIHPHDLEYWEARINGIIREGKACKFEYRITRSDGSIRYLYAQVEPTLIEEKVVRLFGTVMDITERKIAQIALQQANEQLEQRVEERTAELRQTIEQLQSEIAYRQQAQSQLRQSQRRYETLTQLLPVGIFHTDNQGNCLYTNERWREITSLSAEQARGDGWSNAIHPDDRARVFSEWQQATQQNVPFQSDYRFAKLDGQVAWVFGQAVAETGEAGEVLGYVGAITDITDRVLAEQALRDSERRFRAIFDQSFQFVGLLKPDGTLTQANQTALDFGGIEPANVIGQLFWETPWWRLSTQTQERLKVAIAQAASGQLIRYEVNAIGAGDQVITVDFSLKPVLDETGAVVLLIAEGRDISKQQALEAELAQQQELLNSLIANAPVGIAILNSDLRYLQINETLAAINGVPVAEHIGKTMTEILPDIAPKVEPIYRQILATGEAILNIEICGETPRQPGVMGTCLVSCIPLRSENNTPIAIGLIVIEITERKQAEAALAESEERFRKIFDCAPIAIALSDVNTNQLVKVNHALCEMLNYSESELLEMSVAQISHPEDMAQELKLGEDIKTGVLATSQFEKRFITKNQEIVLGSLKETLLRDRDGNPSYWLGMVENITERKRAEIELQQQAQLLDQLYDSVVTADLIGNITRWNKGAERIYGYTAAETIGQPISLLFPADQHERLHNLSIILLEQQGSYEKEFKALRKSGEVFDLLLCVSLERDSEGIAIGSIGYGIDITERKRAEAERRATAQKLELMIQQTPLAVIEWGTPELTVVGWNPASEKIFGYSADEVIGRSLFGLIISETTRENVEQIQAGLLSLKGGFHAINENITKDGRALICEWHNTPLADEQGQVVGIISLGLDITERVQTEEALRLSEAQFRTLAQREELINRLTSQIRQSLNLSEILKTTVNAIRELLEVERCHFSWYCPEGIKNEALMINSPCWETVQESRLPETPSRLGVYLASDVGPLGQKVVDSAEEICIDDVDSLDEPVFQEFLRTHEIASFLSFPVHTRTGEVGVIACIRSPHPRPWCDSERELLRAITGQLAIAIDQAGLYEQTSVAAAVSQAKSLELEHALRELQQTQSQLIQSEKMSSLGQLVAGVAHEINNPVSFIYGNIMPAQDYALGLLKLLQLYQEVYPQPPAKIENEIRNIDLEFLAEDLPKLLGSMKVGAERIQEIVRSLRNFSRLDEAQMKEVNIHEGIDSTLMILNSRLRAKSTSPAIEVIKEYGDLPLVECYAGQLNQVFMNLLTNAIDALEERDSRGASLQQSRQIRIRTSLVNKNKLIISIADNGYGISESAQQKLFDPFFTTKPIGKGTGLGLAISYQIVVEKHKGSLQCVSQVGRGTEFIIEIPIDQHRPEMKL